MKKIISFILILSLLTASAFADAISDKRIKAYLEGPPDLLLLRSVDESLVYYSNIIVQGKAVSSNCNDSTSKKRKQTCPLSVQVYKVLKGDRSLEKKIINISDQAYEKIRSISDCLHPYLLFIYGVDKNMNADLMDSSGALNNTCWRDRETVDYFEAVIKKQEKTKHPPSWGGAFHMGLYRKIEGSYRGASNILLVEIKQSELAGLSSIFSWPIFRPFIRFSFKTTVEIKKVIKGDKNLEKKIVKIIHRSSEDFIQWLKERKQKPCPGGKIGLQEIFEVGQKVILPIPEKAVWDNERDTIDIDRLYQCTVFKEGDYAFPYAEDIIREILNGSKMEEPKYVPW